MSRYSIRAWCCRRFFLLVIACAIIAVPDRSTANDSALNDGGYGPEPLGQLHGYESQVELTSESLRFDISPNTTSVTAVFTFRNTSDTSVSQLLGFPDLDSAGVLQYHMQQQFPELHDPVNIMAPLRNMRTFIDQVEVSSTLQKGWVNRKPNESWDMLLRMPGRAMAWHTFKVAFPPSATISVLRQYSTENSGIVYPPGLKRYFSYTTITGAAWNGDIEELQAEVVLHGGLTEKVLTWAKEDLQRNAADVEAPSSADSLEEAGPLCKPPKGDWTILSPTRLHLIWQNFEPRTDEDQREITVSFYQKSRGKDEIRGAAAEETVGSESSSKNHPILNAPAIRPFEKAHDGTELETPAAINRSLTSHELLNSAGTRSKMIVCLDPGHPSEGAAGDQLLNGIREVELCWEICQLVRSELERAGITVVMTKSAERELVTNRKRAEIANEANAQVLVRVHADAVNSGGFAIYYPRMKGTSRQGDEGPSDDVIAISEPVAQRFYKAFSQALDGELRDKGLRGEERTYIGQRQGGALTGSIYSKVPTLLVEMVDLRNPSDVRWIKRPENKQKMATAITSATLSALQP